MISDALKPNVQDLQTDVIDLLGQISSLMHRASTVLSSDSAGKKYGEFQQEVADAARNVEKLELMMAIVAPMKAGKSTIINAIIGQDILPSRNAAMTTLPTKIVFNAELREPTLTLSDEILSVFQETLRDLRYKIQALGTEQMQEKIAHHPHLVELLKEIQDTVEFPIHARTSGREEIKKTLTNLNDIIRLSSLIGLSQDPLGQLMDVPCIETPFWRAQKTDQPQMLGNLVIVDTPGPNEAGENLRLAAVVKEQLRKSSMVLIVLDFTQLKTEAAEKVKKEVQKVIQLRGKENLYVLINKVDQRQDGDMTYKEVQQFVAAELGLDDSSDTNRVFEVSARRAFSAANFMQELEQYPDVAITQMHSVPSLAQQVFGIEWEDELKEATRTQLKRKAERLWEKSGFSPFLEKAINTILEQVAPRCIGAALKLSLNRLMELSDDVNLLRSTLAQDEIKIQLEIDALNADIAELETRCGLWQPNLDDIQNKLEQDMNDFLTKIKKKFASTLNKSNLQPAKKPDSIKDLNEMGWSEISELDTEHFTAIFLDQLYLSGIKKFGFESELQATHVSSQVGHCLKEFIETLINSMTQSIEETIEFHSDNLSELIDTHPRIIIENAQNRLQKIFNLVLKLEAPKLNNSRINIANLGSKCLSESKPNISTRLHNYFIRLLKINHLIIKENYYYINLEAYVQDANQLISDEVEKLEKDLRTFIKEDFNQKINQYIEALKTYLSNYKSNLEQAIKDKALAAAPYEALKKNLDSFILVTDELIKKIKGFLTSTNQLLDK